MAGRGKFLPRIAFAAALAGMALAPARGQSLNAPSIAPQSSSARAPDWEIAAGGKMAFDTATVRQNTSPPPYRMRTNFPLGPGDVYMPNGALLQATGFPLITYIRFAYKITPSEELLLVPQLPKWATTDRFDIEARAEGNPTKDQMRLMVRSLLANRFRLMAHHEIRQVPVYALLLDQPGKLGPLLQKHPDDFPCPTTPMPISPAPSAPPRMIDARFPRTCGGFLDMAASAAGRIRTGARNVPMQLIADSLADVGLDRPIWDRTNLTGNFDVAIEYVPDIDGRSQLGSDFRPDPAGPHFEQAVKEQLGLKFEAQTGPVDVLVVDYIEQLAAN